MHSRRAIACDVTSSLYAVLCASVSSQQQKHVPLDSATGRKFADGAANWNGVSPKLSATAAPAGRLTAGRTPRDKSSRSKHGCKNAACSTRAAARLCFSSVVASRNTSATAVATLPAAAPATLPASAAAVLPLLSPKRSPAQCPLSDVSKVRDLRSAAMPKTSPGCQRRRPLPSHSASWRHSPADCGAECGLRFASYDVPHANPPSITAQLPGAQPTVPLASSFSPSAPPPPPNWQPAAAQPTRMLMRCGTGTGASRLVQAPGMDFVIGAGSTEVFVAELPLAMGIGTMLGQATTVASQYHLP